jgi:hypothetical protein|tara:strand:+ start:2278 stop:2442 length:165 start_codon:yes stop_codon:yes gene_type:complete
MKGNLREKMNEYADFISGGACKDYSEYTKLCGIIEGLAIAEREILDLAEKYESE